MSLDQIVVCAFGPLPVTKKAVARARALLSPRGRVIVFPAVRAAADGPLRGLSGLRAPDVTVVEAVGRAGAEAALASCAPGPVLFLHDDVVVPRQALRRMTTAALAPRDIVVPYSNDNGVDATVGPLPPSAQAAGALRRLAGDPRLVARTAVAARPGCLLAERTVLADLLDEGLASAVTLIQNPRRPFRVAAGAVVAHDGTCTSRLAPPEGPDGRPLLVASMIVRDEAELLPDCLASLEGLVDRVEICDTGSRDDTVAIAAAAGAHVIERTWRDDFAWARNQVLDHCRDAWYVLHIDADERVECADPAALRRFLATHVDHHRAFGVSITNVAADDVATTTFSATRLFNPDGVRFAGALHETPELGPGRPVSGPSLRGLRLRHLGYRDDLVADRGKGARNVDIARSQYEADPSPQAALHYARSLAFAGTGEELQERLYLEALESDRLNDSARAMVLASLAELALAAGDPRRALELASEALDLVPAEDRAATAYGRAAEQLGDPAQVLEMAARRRARASAAPLVASSEQRTQARSREVAAHALLGDADAALRTALEILDDAPAGFDAWPELVAVVVATRPADAPALLVPAAIHDATGACFAAVMHALPPAATAEFCLRYCEAGGTLEEAVRVGLVAALLRGRDDLFDGLLVHADRLHPEVLRRIAERAAARGADDAAARLRAVLGETSPSPATTSAPVDAADPLSRLRRLEQLRATS